MVFLVDVFEASRAPGAAGWTASGADGGEALLASVCARGRAAHPDLPLADEVFVAHLARCGAPLETGTAELHVEDLYLACACLERLPGAVARLQALHRPHLERFVRRFGNGKAFLEEVEQRLWDGLLIGSVGGPRLASYAGMGALERWIGVSAQRIALMVMRHEDAEGRARDEVAAQARLLPRDPELEAIKNRYREPFQRAIDAAIQTMDDREKVLYRMHLVEGLTLERIATAYGVHHTTVLRWLRAGSARVLEEAKRLLRAELNLETREFDSLVRLLVSQLDLDISRVLEHAD